MSRMHNPAHPGEVLKEWIPAGLSVTEAAIQLGVSRVMLSRILNCKAGVSADMALRLSVWLGTSPEVWVDMQAARDLWEAEQRPRPEVYPMRLAGRIAA